MLARIFSCKKFPLDGTVNLGATVYLLDAPLIQSWIFFIKGPDQIVQTMLLKAATLLSSVS